VKEQGELNRHIVFESVVMLFAKSYQNSRVETTVALVHVQWLAQWPGRNLYGKFRLSGAPSPFGVRTKCHQQWNLFFFSSKFYSKYKTPTHYL